MDFTSFESLKYTLTGQHINLLGLDNNYRKGELEQIKAAYEKEKKDNMQDPEKWYVMLAPIFYLCLLYHQISIIMFYGKDMGIGKNGVCMNKIIKYGWEIKDAKSHLDYIEICKRIVYNESMGRYYKLTAMIGKVIYMPKFMKNAFEVFQEDQLKPENLEKGGLSLIAIIYLLSLLYKSNNWATESEYRVVLLFEKIPPPHNKEAIVSVDFDEQMQHVSIKEDQVLLLFEHTKLTLV